VKCLKVKALSSSHNTAKRKQTYRIYILIFFSEFVQDYEKTGGNKKLSFYNVRWARG
jgi:hypothetical protein